MMLFGDNITEQLTLLLARLAVAVFILPFHEAAHAWVADILGDPTAKQQGRITLNPVRHFDKVGLVTMLLLGVGWEKPVPVNSRNFKNPRRDYAIVALAGPMSNFLMGFVFVGISDLLFPFIANIIVYYLYLIFANMAYVSIFLGVFNLIPLPPLDGFNVIGYFLPEKLYNQIYQYGRYILLILFALIFFGIFNLPLDTIAKAIFSIFSGFFSLFGVFR